MKVDALRGDIGGNKNPYRRFFAAKVFNYLLLLRIAHAAVHFRHCRAWEPQVFTQLSGQKAHGLNSLCENNNTVIALVG